MKRNLISVFIASIITFLTWTFLKVEMASLPGFLTAIISFFIADMILGKTIFKDNKDEEEK